MRRGKIDKELLVKKTMQLFQEKGYHNTTMDDIAKACKIQKSSLYHHIPSRKMLVTQVIKHLLSDFRNNYYTTVYDKHLSANVKLNTLADSIHKFFIDEHGGRLLGSLAVELAYGFSDIKNLFHQHFNDWIEAITHVLSYQQSEESAKTLAQDIVSQIQGAIILQQACDHDDYSLFERAIKRLTCLVER